MLGRRSEMSSSDVTKVSRAWQAEVELVLWARVPTLQTGTSLAFLRRTLPHQIDTFVGCVSAFGQLTAIFSSQTKPFPLRMTLLMSVCSHYDFTHH